MRTMKTMPLGSSPLESSQLTYGCMRISEDPARGKAAVRAAFDAGYNHFDHADIYGGGECERIFAEVLKDVPGMRDQVLITSKCGVCLPGDGRVGQYNLDRQYILDSVDGMLQRLECGHLDILLLHRPDYLFHPAEAAAAFETLKDSGKVKWFGVSNFKPSLFAAMRQHCSMPLIVNQVEINIHRIDALLDGTLDQCLELGVTPQAWCPLGGAAYPAWGNTFDEAAEGRIADEFLRQSGVYGVEPWIVVLAWILKLPAGVNPIIGSTTPERIRDAKKALELEYQRDDWYRLLEARNGHPVP